ncbi:MAG TPA: cation transporter [Methylophilaceae bacterium]|nr:cation transporter [Methylophilaceae bacterium]
MADDCCNDGCSANKAPSIRFKKVLWAALAINLVMFAVEVAGGISSGSVSLMADAMDFLGDAANYVISLVVLPLGIVWRARAALIKGTTMGLFGVFVLGSALWSFMQGGVPHAYTMGIIAVMALIANISVAFMLYAFREGDANMRSVWLCSRNDAIANIAVLLAAVGVFGIGSAWPDLLVAVIIAGLGLSSGLHVLKQAILEIRTNQITSN